MSDEQTTTVTPLIDSTISDETWAACLTIAQAAPDRVVFCPHEPVNKELAKRLGISEQQADWLREVFVWLWTLRECGITPDVELVLRYESVVRVIRPYRKGGEADRLFWLEIAAATLAQALEYLEAAQRGISPRADVNASTLATVAAEAIQRLKDLAVRQAERLLTDDWFHWGPCLRGLLYNARVSALSPADLKNLAQIWREIAEAARARRLALESQAKTQQTAEAQQPAPKANGRGRLPKDVHQEKYATFMNLLRDHPSFKDDPELLAEKVGVSAKTIRCWLAEEERRYLESRVNHPEADELD